MIWCNRLLKMTLRDLRDEKGRGRSPAWSWWHWCRSADARSASLILFLVLLLSLLLLPLALAFVVLNGLGHGGTRLSLDAFPSTAFAASWALTLPGLMPWVASRCRSSSPAMTTGWSGKGLDLRALTSLLNLDESG